MLNLNKLLEKRGLDYTDLTEDERRVYEEWSRILSAPNVSIDDLKKFLPQQLAAAETAQNNYNNTKDKDLFLKAYIRLLKMTIAFITGPDKRKEWLENHLGQLTD